MKQPLFKPHPFHLIRTPLLSFNHIVGLTRYTADPLGLSASHVREEIAFTKKQLRSAYRDPVLQEAIFLASPELAEKLPAWIDGNIADEKEDHQLALTMLKYFVRMASRSTPFGLFAGVAVGTSAPQTSLLADQKEKNRRQARLDMNYLSQLARRIINIDPIKSQLSFYPNSSCYPVGEELRYIEARIQNDITTHHLVSTPRSAYLDRILETAKKGATIQTLAATIDDADITQEDALQFIHDLIDGQLLVSTLEPNLTGQEFLTTLIQKLSSLKHTEVLCTDLQTIRTLLQQLDQSDLHKDFELYHSIQGIIARLPGSSDVKNIFQVDMVSTLKENTISHQAVRSVQKALDFMAAVNAPRENPNLAKFKEVFSDRYEGQEIPLTQLLDPELGIKYPIYENDVVESFPLLDDFLFPRYLQDVLQQSISTHYNFNRFKFEKYTEAITDGHYTLELTASDLQGLKHDTDVSIPRGLYVLAELIKDPAAPGKDHIFIKGGGGPSAASFMSRFSQDNPDLFKKLAAVMKAEESQRPDAIFAEIIHSPKSRTGNVLRRPLMREHEIPFLSSAGVPEHKQIPISDIQVSLRGGYIYLRSKKFDKEIIPCLTTAHNYFYNSMPIYHFLCDVQQQGKQPVFFWDWEFFKSAPFLPRVVYENVILSPARWLVKRQEFEPLFKLSPEEAFIQFQDIKRRRKFPKYIQKVDGDNLLVIDTDNPLSVASLVHEAKTRKGMTLEELIGAPDNLVLHGTGGYYRHELLIPFARTIATPPMNGSQHVAKHSLSHARRKFLPGKEWLYLKLYCGVKTTDNILVDVVKPLADELLKRNEIEKWMFVRYHDPDHHVRLRFYAPGKGSAWRIADAFTERIHPLIDQHIVEKIQLDTYAREIERYGDIVNSETIFFHDSQAVARLLEIFRSNGEELHWLVAIKGIDLILRDLQFSAREKMDLVFQKKMEFAKEFGTDTAAFKERLGTQYRKNRDLIASVVEENDPLLAAYIPVLHTRSADWQPSINNILKTCPGVRERSSLAVSFIHMFVNRLLRARQREHELILYDFLYFHYRSEYQRSTVDTAGRKF